MPLGFRLLVNLSQLKSMNNRCFWELGVMMGQFDHAGVGLVVRVNPDESKDIGFNIPTGFHYPRRPRNVTCLNPTERRGCWGYERPENQQRRN